jgi:hypothetical protein
MFNSYENYQSLGMERSGTNWLNQLILINFEVNSIKENKSFWKHLTPLGVKENLFKNNNKSYINIESLILKDSTFYIGSYKEYDTWIKSIKNKSYHIHVHNTKTNFPEKEIYNSWLNWAKSQLHKENFYMKKYTDWLKNWKSYLSEIKQITNWQIKEPEWVETKHVPLSEFSNEFYRNKYLKNEQTSR